MAWTHHRLTGGAVVLLVLGLGAAGCARLGYSNRVLLRVPAPDGAVVAVCQEIPEFDGPGYVVRLESPAGSLVRRLYETGDGNPCDEMAWSPDGHTLGVLSAGVARVRFVDVESALANGNTERTSGESRMVDLSGEADRRMGRGFRFVGPNQAELTVCSYSLSETQRTHQRRCTSSEVRKQFDVPRRA